MTNPNEPTLTCSEVVERLATEAHGEHCFDASFEIDKALAILAEWQQALAKRFFIPPMSACKHERLNADGVSDCGYWVGNPSPEKSSREIWNEACREKPADWYETKEMEVVERLRTEAYQPYGNSDFDTDKAETILHSWRERRVQELEEYLRELKPHLTGWMRESAERVLQSDEWREQIRKGAKHD